MKFTLSNSEQLILEMLWAQKDWMTIQELAQELQKKNITWKRQTINTFLSRLKEKELVIQNGRRYIYAFSKKEFDGLKAKEILNTEFDGSLCNFISALSGHKTISSDDAESLRKYLETFE